MTAGKTGIPDIKELRKVKAAAKRGPWEWRMNHRQDMWAFDLLTSEKYERTGLRKPLLTGKSQFGINADDAEFITTFNPQLVGKLLDRIEELEAPRCPRCAKPYTRGPGGLVCRTTFGKTKCDLNRNAGNVADPGGEDV